MVLGSGPRTSGLSTLNEDQIAERGARMARRDDREYREYLREEQRSQPGCPAREVVLDQRGRATSRYKCDGFVGPPRCSALSVDNLRMKAALHRARSLKASNLGATRC